jgi:hypothetical protein
MLNRIGSKWIGPLAAALMVSAAAANAEAPRGVFTITNASTRYVECNLLVDGHTLTYLKLHVGGTYTSNYRFDRRLDLVCMRGFEDIYGPLKFGVEYRFVDKGDHRVAVVEGAAE